LRVQNHQDQREFMVSAAVRVKRSVSFSASL
jgi:hypothetical protein